MLKPNDWENPKITNINRLPGHASFGTYDDVPTFSAESIVQGVLLISRFLIPTSLRVGTWNDTVENTVFSSDLSSRACRGISPKASFRFGQHAIKKGSN